MLETDDPIWQLANRVGRAALAREWATVHGMLAPWLRATLTVDDVRAFFEDEYRATLAEYGIDDMAYPEHPDPEIGGNAHTNATSLREPISWDLGRTRPVPPELTDENMRYWARVQLSCSDEQMETFEFDYFAEVWMAIAETDEGLRVGYWSHGAY